MKQTFEELMTAPIPKSWINQPIDFEVDFAVEPETAIERARRRWKMEEPTA